MALTNREVVQCWRNGQPAANHRGSLITDGRSLFSYQLQIGATETDGLRVRKIVFYARAPQNFYSQTTSAHVGYAARVASEVVTDKAAFNARAQLAALVSQEQ